MNTPAPKILSEFTLLPANSERLGAHFTQNQHSSSMAIGQLSDVLRETLPPEALEEAGRICRGQSEYALLIHGLPETDRDPYYADSITRAIYQMNGVEFYSGFPLTRTKYDCTFAGSRPHRDYPRSQISGIAVPHNAEHALTEIIDMEGALRLLPPEFPLSIEMNVSTPGLQRTMFQNTTATELLTQLSGRAASRFMFVKEIVPSDQAAYEAAIAQNNVKRDLQPGDLLLWDEDRFFHRAHKGQEDIVPDELFHSRLLRRYAGRQPARSW